MAKRFIALIVPTVIFLMFFSSVIIIAKNNGQETSQVETSTDALYGSSKYLSLYKNSKAKSYFAVTSDFQLVAENDNLALYMKPSSLAIRLLNKKTGYIWSSNFDSYEQERLNSTWKAYIESGITIEYCEINAKTQNYTISQESVLTSDRTTVNFEQLEKGIRIHILFGESNIELTYAILLEESGIQVILHPEDIREAETGASASKNKSPKRLVSVTFFPFLGSTKAQGQEGYFLIPDGDGALVNFKKSYSNINTGYKKAYYGEDVGLVPETGSMNFIKDSKPLNHPIYGIVHGVSDNGLVVLIEKGSSNAELIMNPAGIRTDYYYITNRFLYRQPYLFIVNSSVSSLVMQETMTPVDVQMDIMLLSGDEANYMGIAKKYREFLGKEGLLPEGQVSPEVPLMLDVLMSSVEPGIFFNKIIPMTSIKQLGNIYMDLKDSGIEKTVVTAQGMFKDTVTAKAKDRFRINRKIGDTNELKDLADTMRENGDLLTLQFDYEAHNYKRYADIKPEADLLHMMNGNILYYERYIGLKKVKSTLLNAKGFQKYVVEDENRLNSLGVDGVSYWLPKAASSYGKVTMARSDYFNQMAKTLKDSGIKYRYIGWKQASAEILAGASGIKNVWMETTLYPYITDPIPFTSLVYHGSIDLFSLTLNTVGDPDIRKLKMVEWGVYPAFDITYEDPGKLIYSDNWYLVSSRFDDWKEEILETYRFVAQALKYVVGESIADHQVLAAGINRTTYSNGVSIIVNYTDKDYVSGNLHVAAGSYEVILP